MVKNLRLKNDWQIASDKDGYKDVNELDCLLQERRNELKLQSLTD